MFGRVRETVLILRAKQSNNEIFNCKEIDERKEDGVIRSGF